MKGRAIVVGAGIAGLAAARSLVAAGWAVEVRERRGTLSPAGTLLSLWPAAWEALSRLGAAEGLETIQMTAGQLLRPDGRVMAALALPDGTCGVGRMNLVTTLLDGLPAGSVLWNSGVESPAELPKADVVVAADGVHSRLRPAAFPGARLRDAKIVAFRGVAAIETPLGSETWGRGLIFGRAPFPGGGSNWYAGVRSDLADSTGEDPLVILRRLYRGWHPAVRQVLDVLTPEMIDRRRIEEMRPLKSYVNGSVVLVGDAAHAMAPHLGRGGCESLVDGLALGEALSTAGSVAEGLERYDAERRRRSQRAVLGSRLMNRLSNQQSHPWLRDAFATGAGRLIAMASGAAASKGHRQF